MYDFVPHKKKRLTKRLTLMQLSKRSGVSKSMIHSIERNEKHPTLPVLLALARALHADIKELYNEV